jgi:hypothetical protein
MVIFILRQHWDPSNKTIFKAIGRTFNSTGYFMPPHQKECSINRPVGSTSAGRVCVNVCGVSAARLRHVSTDADVFICGNLVKLIFREQWQE